MSFPTAPIPVIAQTDRIEGFRPYRSFTNTALIILSENNMVARADHGMIRLGDGPDEVRK